MNKPDSRDFARTPPPTCPGRRSASTCCARNTPRAPSATSTARRWRARCGRASPGRSRRSRPIRRAWEPVFLKALEDGFIPGGRINSAAGADIDEVTLINCFVQPVGDSISETVDGKPGIYIALREAAETMRRGGGVGYDFSAIRPRGARGARHRQRRLRADQLHARLRPVLRDGGERRRAARRADGRAALRPSRRDGVRLRQAAGGPAQQLQHLGRRHRRADGARSRPTATFELVHKAEPGAAQIAGGAHRRDDGLWVYATIRARELWRTIMRNTYEAAEPGVLFLDRINAENNLHYCEAIEATNPCGENPDPRPRLLLPRLDRPDPLRPRPVHAEAPGFDRDALRRDGGRGVRMLDNVLTATVWPLPAAGGGGRRPSGGSASASPASATR